MQRTSSRIPALLLLVVPAFASIAPAQETPPISPDAAATAAVAAACVNAVAKQSGAAANTLSTTAIAPSNGGLVVTVRVPGNDATWTCQADAQGNVQGVSQGGAQANP
jgi:hypothetical protein